IMKKIIFVTLILIFFTAYSKVINLSTSPTGISLTFDISEEYEINDFYVEGNKYKNIFLPDNFTVLNNFEETESFSTTYFFSVPNGSTAELNYSTNKSISFNKNDLVPSKSPSKGPSGIITMNYKEFEHRNDIERPVAEIEYVGRIKQHNLYMLTYYPMIFKGDKAYFNSQLKVNIKFNRAFSIRPTKKSIPYGQLEEKILNLSYSKANPYIRSKQIAETFLDKHTEWLKLKISEEGIYRVTGAMISARGIDISSALPSSIKIYSSAGEDLSNSPKDSIYNDQPIYHGAEEIAREIIDIDGDPMFGSDDYIEFYALKNNSWKRGEEFEHYYNKYSDYSYYWIDLGIGDPVAGKTVDSLNTDSAVFTEIDTFNRQYFFDNRDQVAHSSDYKYHWYTKLIPDLQTISYNFPMRNIDANESVILKANYSISYRDYSGYVKIKYKINNDLATEREHTAVNYETAYLPEYFTSGQINTLTMSNLSTDKNIKYFYNFEIHYKGSVSASEENEFFVSEMDTTQAYRMNLGQSAGKKLFDITDPYNVRSAILEDDFITIEPTGSINHFILWNNEYLTPQSIEVLDYTNKNTLHSITDQFDMVIISPDEFFSYYENDSGLGEAHRNADDPINSVKVVNIKDINNEFGRGYQEPAATRNFIRYAFENWNTEFILLGADGNYNFKNFLDLNEKNLIYPSDLGGSGAKVGSDDFYANLESTTAGMQHISIGRFPASNLAELQNIIDKTISHINSDNLSNINT
ncbi:MAG: hypothetical protein KAH33_05950, partial [Candidatus Delongbacteria bacterium]|nr:hypothetical protein [Candidatus Delongbacteria bacterium]